MEIRSNVVSKLKENKNNYDLGDFYLCSSGRYSYQRRWLTTGIFRQIDNQTQCWWARRLTEPRLKEHTGKFEIQFSSERFTCAMRAHFHFNFK